MSQVRDSPLPHGFLLTEFPPPLHAGAQTCLGLSSAADRIAAGCAAGRAACRSSCRRTAQQARSFGARRCAALLSSSSRLVTPGSASSLRRRQRWARRPALLCNAHTLAHLMRHAPTDTSPAAQPTRSSLESSVPSAPRCALLSSPREAEVLKCCVPSLLSRGRRQRPLAGVKMVVVDGPDSWARGMVDEARLVPTLAPEKLH